MMEFYLKNGLSGLWAGYVPTGEHVSNLSLMHRILARLYGMLSKEKRERVTARDFIGYDLSKAYH